MDEPLRHEMDPIEAVEVQEGGLLERKDREYAVKLPETSRLFEPSEAVTRDKGDSPESRFHMLASMLEGKHVEGSGSSVETSQHSGTSPGYMDDAGNMVEELTVRSYDSSNMEIVGTLNHGPRIPTMQGQWQPLYHFGGGQHSGNPYTNTLQRHFHQVTPAAREDVCNSSFLEPVGQKPSADNYDERMEQPENAKSGGFSGAITSRDGIRTKILSKSGFSEYFVKNALQGKGVIYREPPEVGTRPELRNQKNLKADGGTLVVSNTPPSLKTGLSSSFGSVALRQGHPNCDGVSLRAWLNARRHKVNKVQCLHIFKQIVDLVDYSHSKGVTLHDFRPSSFKLLPSNQVKYIGLPAKRNMLELAIDQDTSWPENHLIRRRPPVEQVNFPSIGLSAKKQKLIQNPNYIQRWPQFKSKFVSKAEVEKNEDVKLAGTQVNEQNPDAEYGNKGKLSSYQLQNTAQQQLMSVNDNLEQRWYASPEEVSQGTCSMSSNIYALGVLLFELLGHFDSETEHATAMSDLCHRILPPRFLSENPKEAGFCLWLLYPEPSSRPTAREILQSELINGLQEMSAEESLSSLDQDDAESELLLHFLVSLNDHKQKHASKLDEDIRCLEADIEEVRRRNSSIKSSSRDYLDTDTDCGNPGKLRVNRTRFMNSMDQLENAYFSMRSNIQRLDGDATLRQDRDLLRNLEDWNLTQEDNANQTPNDRVGAFFNGLCKYARYGKFEVRGLLRAGDFNNSANVICSLGFDRDMEYIAAAGISKKIKIFEFNALLNNPVDTHYPVIEMSNKSRVSCVSWNNYVKNYLASTGYDGVVKLWDVSTGQGVFEYSDHAKRAWSVDFSAVNPTKLASGSDDCSVKLWSINEKQCLGTIRNVANICCVQFSSHSSHLLAFGSADYRTYCYDLRNLGTPWCVLVGHNKAVSYVKFVDSETLVTASTDNTLKLWDLNKTSYGALSTSACSLTLSGHTNEKNFVGLSVADGYVVCGSETNEVYGYHRSLPIPITSYKFGSIDPISGRETEDDNGQFVSSVCWRGNSDMVIAANSTGCIKVLQMV